MDPTGVIEGLEATIDAIPGALLAIALLVGPTSIWLLYRFVVQPRSSRYEGNGPEPLWVCSTCRSANQVRASRCYSCGLERGSVAAELTDQAATASSASATPAPASAAPTAAVSAAIPVAVMAPVTRPVATPPRRLVAVGPGTAKPASTLASEAGSETPDERTAAVDTLTV